MDCISAVQGLGDFEQVKKMSDIFEVDDIILNVLNREALIKSKKALDRPRDREAVRELETIIKINSKQNKECKK